MVEIDKDKNIILHIRKIRKKVVHGGEGRRGRGWIASANQLKADKEMEQMTVFEITDPFKK